MWKDFGSVSRLQLKVSHKQHNAFYLIYPFLSLLMYREQHAVLIAFPFGASFRSTFVRSLVPCLLVFELALFSFSLSLVNRYSFSRSQHFDKFSSNAFFPFVLGCCNSFDESERVFRSNV